MAHKPPSQGPGLFDPPPAAPAPPARSPLERALIEFAQRRLGRQFTWPEAEQAARAAEPGAPFGAGLRAMAALHGGGVIEYEKVGGGFLRITAVKP